MNKDDVIKKLRDFIYCNFPSQKKYAENIGLSRNFVSMVLKGNREPTNYMLHDIGILKTKVTVYSVIKSKGEK